jgi:hypothetical protein
MSQDYDVVVGALATRRLAARLGYVREDIGAAIAPMRAALSGSTCTASWSLADVLALELWLQTFFDKSGKQAESGGAAVIEREETVACTNR